MVKLLYILSQLCKIPSVGPGSQVLLFDKEFVRKKKRKKERHKNKSMFLSLLTYERLFSNRAIYSQYRVVLLQ